MRGALLGWSAGLVLATAAPRPGLAEPGLAALSDPRPLVGGLPLRLGGPRPAALARLVSCREATNATWCRLVRKQEGMLAGLEGSAWLTFRDGRLTEVALPIQPGQRTRVVQALVTRYGDSDPGSAYRRVERGVELEVAADEVRYRLQEDDAGR